MNRLVLNADKTPNIAELAPMIDGKPDVTKLTEIDLRSWRDGSECRGSSLRRRATFTTRWSRPGRAAGSTCWPSSFGLVEQLHRDRKGHRRSAAV